MIFRIIALYLALLSGNATCSTAQIDELAPEAQEGIDTLAWDFPAETPIVDDRDGSIWIVKRRWLPFACRSQYEDSVTVVTPKGWYER